MPKVDLVEISPNAEPPVCKLMDYGKFIYQQKKREKERQMLATHVQMNSKRLTENQKNTNAQVNKEANAKHSAENLSEAYRQENIRRMQRLVGSN